MLSFVPPAMFFTKGVGRHREKLSSFELALRSLGIAACNPVRVSSIFPPGCRIIPGSDGVKRIRPGQVTFRVMSEAATREPHRLSRQIVRTQNVARTAVGDKKGLWTTVLSAAGLAGDGRG